MTDDNKARVVRLAEFLKFVGACSTGGAAKMRVQSGEVTVNGVVETQRKKQLTAGDVVEVDGEKHVVP